MNYNKSQILRPSESKKRVAVLLKALGEPALPLITWKFFGVRVGVRHPLQSGWLDEWGRLKGGRPIYPNVPLKRALVP